ncbi:MAG: hypothetical protein AAFR47_09715 [Pseudomonadota bacterium]
MKLTDAGYGSSPPEYTVSVSYVLRVLRAGEEDPNSAAAQTDHPANEGLRSGETNQADVPGDVGSDTCCAVGSNGPPPEQTSDDKAAAPDALSATDEQIWPVAKQVSLRRDGGRPLRALAAPLLQFQVRSRLEVPDPTKPIAEFSAAAPHPVRAAAGADGHAQSDDTAGPLTASAKRSGGDPEQASHRGGRQVGILSAAALAADPAAELASCLLRFDLFAEPGRGLIVALALEPGPQAGMRPLYRAERVAHADALEAALDAFDPAEAVGHRPGHAPVIARLRADFADLLRGARLACVPA